MAKKTVNVNIDYREPGFLADYLVVSHNPKKFILDFVQVTPRFDKVGDEMKQSLSYKHNTIIVDPETAKSILGILNDNIKKFEERFSKIKTQKGKSKSEQVEYSEEATRYIG